MKIPAKIRCYRPVEENFLRISRFCRDTGKTYRVVLSDKLKISSGHLDYTKKAEPFLTLPVAIPISCINYFWRLILAPTRPAIPVPKRSIVVGSQVLDL